MAGVDKHYIKELLDKGWIDISTNDDLTYKMVPPESLWKNKPTSFHLYRALELQALLENEIEKEA